MYLFTLGISLLYTFGYSVPNGVLNHFLDKRYSWINDTKKRTIWAIVLVVSLNVFLTYALNFINFVLIQGLDSQKFLSGEMNFVNWFFINFALLISTFLHARGFMQAMKQSAKKEVVEQKLIAKSANAQFESLKNQLDPHFLFNSLNVLTALIDENPHQAQKFTNNMSKIYRYVLDQKDKELVTVEEEIEFAKTYCGLLKTRFEDSVSFDFNVEEPVKQQFVVPLSLQLLLENAIKHNHATSKKPLCISIHSENGFLCIENNLQAREIIRERDGIGLSNIVQRYSILTDKNVFIEKSEEFFKVKIPVLTQKSTAMNTQNLTSNEMIAYEKASKRVKELKGFYSNLISFCIFMPFLFFLNWKISPGYWWAFWALFGWGIGVIVQGVQVLGIGREWEEKQIRKILEKENYSQKWK
ncbi:MAG: histidine kinase [Bergeyella sp.]